MAESRLKSLITRLFITIIGLGFILWGISIVSLGFVGERESALITEVRRQGGQRNEANPNRYTYVVSYTFTLPDGKKVDGFTFKVGSGVYVKNPNAIVPVRYFGFFPWINTLESEAKLSVGLLYTAIGGFLIFAVSNPNAKRKKQKTRRKHKKSSEVKKQDETQKLAPEQAERGHREPNQTEPGQDQRGQTEQDPDV